MSRIEGIEIVKKQDYAICYINEFSEEIAQFIREQLSFICFGRSNSESVRLQYNYKSTLKEFIKRYNEKYEHMKKGMIAELLTHVIINVYFPEYTISSPYFNLEERNIKKGFDVVLYSSLTNNSIITEVKSGELRKNKNSTQTSISLLNTAHNDLNERLNDNTNQSLWQNAINGAKINFDSYRDFKDMMVNILETHHEEAALENQTSRNKDVILVGALFHSLDDIIEELRVNRKTQSLKEKNNFNSLFCLVLQKETYIKIYEFLEMESR